MVVYSLTNTVNGKKYVGLTRRNLETRLYEHRQNARNKLNYPLYKAINKYGWELFVPEILDECETVEELSERERYWIQKLDTTSYGYNLSEGGEATRGNLGNKHSEESKKRMSNAHKGKTVDWSTKTFLIQTPSGEVIEIRNLRQFAKTHNLTYSTLWKTKNQIEGRTQHKGFRVLEEIEPNQWSD